MNRILTPLLLLLLLAPAWPSQAEGGGGWYGGSRSKLDEGVSQEERRSLRRDVEDYGYPARERLQQRRQFLREQLQERWRRADDDNDGSISRDEARRAMPGVSRRFERLDLDGDGVISKEELRSRWERR